MYNLYKYYDITELEARHKKDFAYINYSDNIVVLPPVLRHIGGKLLLAYLVIPEPVERDNHTPVTRPIGAILRHRKTKHVMHIITCDKHEFAPHRNDFEKEYYNLEDHPEYWPNRTGENEEQIRIALQELFRTVNSVNMFGYYDKLMYETYRNIIKNLFPPDFFYFFEALETEPIVAVNTEILQSREQSKQEHGAHNQHHKQQKENETEEARQKFIKETEEGMRMFIRKEISPSAKSRPAYARLDFYANTGKLVKQLNNDEEKLFLNCYNAALNEAVKQANVQQFNDSLRVNLNRLYSKSAAKPLTENESANKISEQMLKMLHSMALQEQTGRVTAETKEDIEGCIDAVTQELENLTDADAKKELGGYFADLKNDYFEAREDNDLSELYLGYMVSHII